ncbi:alpha/beta hydrolase [Streptomyces sp. B1866]|uniref:alpha/beta hydrolase n=1 Tax=Streptomyces sp. B1866 TaxID=3075431 RepID=UPI00289063E7|nr:alpha/beta hydrolase [Streptomyces sp. B1866]MDT3397231.1 alpha/beta hydrolase [Streptomyces sp. B1866]
MPGHDAAYGAGTGADGPGEGPGGGAPTRRSGPSGGAGPSSASGVSGVAGRRGSARRAARALRDREYSPSSLVPDMRRHLAAYAERSALARQRLPWRELAYGPGPAERLHFFPAAGSTDLDGTPGPDGGDAGGPVPLQVYVHGGYWLELSKEDSAFAAPDFAARGAAFAALGYGLAPAHRLDEIVAMVRRGVLWLYRHAPDLGVDPARIFLSGSSAGAHLAAMCLLDNWLPAPLRPAHVVRGATLLSGVYDLEPLRHTYVGDDVRLTRAEAARNSPIRYAHEGFPPVVVARGDNETGAFAAQHDRFVAALTGRGVPVTDLVARPRHHFDLPLDLGDPGTELGRATLSLMGLPARPSG